MKKLNFKSVPSHEVLSRDQLTKVMGGIVANDGCREGYSQCFCEGAEGDEADQGCRTPADCQTICEQYES